MLPALLGLRALGLVRRHGRCALVVVAGLAVAQYWVTHQATSMTDAVVFPAVVPPAIATLAHRFKYGSFLLITGSDCIFRLVVEAAYALAEARSAGSALLEAYAVQLATLTTLAVAVLWSSIFDNLVIVAMQILNLNRFLFLLVHSHGLIKFASECIVWLPGKGLVFDQ